MHVIPRTLVHCYNENGLQDLGLYPIIQAKTHNRSNDRRLVELVGLWKDVTNHSAMIDTGRDTGLVIEAHMGKPAADRLLAPTLTAIGTSTLQWLPL